LSSRIACFCSHLYGNQALKFCLRNADLFEVPLIITDNISHSFTNAQGRIWSHGWKKHYASLVRRTGERSSIPVFDGKIDDPSFIKQFRQANLDGILVACFGQRLSHSMLKSVEFRAYNIHPVIPGEDLSATRGPRPLVKASELRAKNIQLALHQMSDKFDDGDILARGVPLKLPDGFGTWMSSPDSHQTEIQALWSELSQTIPDLLEGNLARLFR
jgi:methionyl-tRNA formyltransferase